MRKGALEALCPALTKRVIVSVERPTNSPACGCHMKRTGRGVFNSKDQFQSPSQQVDMKTNSPPCLYLQASPLLDCRISISPP